MKLGIYNRVSTEEQKKGNSIETQEKKNKEICKRLGYSYKVYNDKGISGKLPIEKRPALKMMLNDIKNGVLNGIVVTKFDRITRNEINFYEIKETLLKTNSKFFLEGQDINLKDYNELFLLGFKNLLATQEVDRLIERSKEGIRTGIERGRVGGGYSIPYGYKKGENKMMVIDEEEANVIQEIFNLSVKGKGQRAIATHLNNKGIETKYQKHKRTQTVNEIKRNSFIWKGGTIAKILRNPIYIGHRLYKGERLPYNENLRIVSEIDFNTSKKIALGNNIFKRTTNRYFYLLSGLLYCGRCGRKMYGKKRQNRKDNAYKCSSTKSHAKDKCGSRGMNIDKLEEIVLLQLKKLPDILETSYKINNDKEIDLDSNQIKSKIDKIKKVQKKTFSMNIPISLQEERINELQKEIDSLERNEKRNNYTKLFYKKKDQLIKDIKKIVSNISYNNPNSEKQNKINREAVTKLIEKINITYINNGKDIKGGKKMQHIVEIIYKIDTPSLTSLSRTLEIDSINYNELNSKIKISHIESSPALIEVRLLDDQL
ncbi:MAG: hypothetical protein CMC13_10475 [Flavobacteriaceae bacterium]|nr:hypothetical protein [Flavobacteriaceae bacterium]|tara:strand:+ start:186 stop:1811 length:1626 start_codon:yes stop_codon:yes gene_type:complete